MTKKIFAMFLALLMVASVLPTSVFAANECPGAGEHTANNCDCVVVKVTEPTCGKTGYTTYQCKVCKEIFADNFKPATGVHNMVAGEGKAPTCGVAGYEAGMECEDCGYAIDRVEIDPVFAAGTTCTYKDLTPNIDCTTGGKKEQKCVVCGHEKTVTIPKGEHAWDYENYVVKVEPTADEAGVVVVTCEACDATKEATWFGSHSCAESAQWNEGFAPTCTIDGVIPHYECRVCGKLYGKTDGKIDTNKKYYAGEVADDEATRDFVEGRGVILKASHTEPAPEAGQTIDLCKDRVAKCTVCKEKVTFKGEHKMEHKPGDLNHANNCTDDGFKLMTCKNCNYTELEKIPAKGHVLHTVTVPATCGTYGYTFTVCMRQGCNKALATTNTWVDEDGVEYDVALDFVPAKELVVGEVTYKFGVAIDKYYPMGTFVLVANTDFQGYPIAGEYKIFTAGGYVKVFEDLVGDEGYGYYAPFVEFTAEASKASVFTWSETYNVFTTSMKRGEYFLMYNYMDDVLLDVADVHMFGYAYYFPYEVFYNTPASQLIEVKVAAKAGFDKDNHDLQKDVVKKATCTEEGLRYDMCTNHDCDYFVEVELAKAKHNSVTLRFKNDAAKGEDSSDRALVKALQGAGYEVALATLEADLVALLNLEDINVTAKTLYRDADCEKAGWAYKLCLDCGEIEKKVTDAYGHTYMTWIAPYHVDATHLNPSYDFWPCYYCDSVKTTNVKPWKDSTKTWNTLDEAIANHGHWNTVEYNGKTYYATRDNYPIDVVYKQNGDIERFDVLVLNKDGELVSTVPHSYPYYTLFGNRGLVPWISDLTNETIYRDGDCEKQGLVRYFCEGCETTVYVKLWKEVEIELNGSKVTVEYMTGSHLVKPGTLDADIKILDANGNAKKDEHGNDIIVLAKDTKIIDTKNPDMAAMYPGAVHFEKKGDCDEYGYVVTYQCACCDKVVGNATASKDGKYTGLYREMGAHDWKIDEERAEYNPCPNGAPYVCADCGATRDTLSDTLALNPCTNTILEYYLCSCGEEHIRGIYGPFGHSYKPAYIENPTADGHNVQFVLVYDCVFCDEGDYKVTLPKIHMNKAEEEFTDLCTDTVKDRHCVLCCTHGALGNTHDCYKKTSGRYTCSCMVVAKCHPIEKSSKPSSCTMPAYKIEVCGDCSKQTVTPVEKFDFKASDLTVDENGKIVLKDTYLATLKVWEKKTNKISSNVDAIDDEIIVGIADYQSAVNFMGHKPAEVDYEMKWNKDAVNADGTKGAYEYVYKDGKKVPIYYSNYVYKEITWTSYKWVEVMVPTVTPEPDHVNGTVNYKYEEKAQTVLVEYTETYIAKYEKYQAPSYAADGVMATKCKICKADVEQVLPKKTGIGFEMSIANANGQSGLAFGSLIEVTVSVNALDAAIYGFEFDVTNTMGKDMIYVGYEIANENFSVTVTDPIKVAHKGADLKISGFAINNADGKVQNIEITEKTALVKLYFRSVSKATGEYKFNFANTAATALVDGATKKIVPGFSSAKATIAGLMDFNGDKVASSADLYQAMTLITGEHASGKTYNVTVDLNKDGELTLEDLAIGYNYLVGNYDRIEMLMLGLSADDAEELAELMKEIPAFSCMNEACDYGSKYYFDVCPVCRTVQPEQKVEEPKAEEIECITKGCAYTSTEAFNYCPVCKEMQNFACVNSKCDVVKAEWFEYCTKCGTEQPSYCEVIGCNKSFATAEDRVYCDDHLCAIADCNKQVVEGKTLCATHKCAKCDNKIVEGKTLCATHKCAKCDNEVVEGKTLCATHKCAECDKEVVEGKNYCADHEMT